MEIEMQKIKVYAKPDASGRIVSTNSSIFLQDTTGWVQIDEGEGDKYAHAQGNYLPGGLFTADGIPIYKLQDGTALERSAAEIESDRAGIPTLGPTMEERVTAVERTTEELAEIVAEVIS